MCDKVCDPPQLYGAPAASDQHCEEADVIGSPTPPSCTPQSPAPQPPARALFFELIRVIRRICRVAGFYAFGSMKERYRIQITHAATRKRSREKWNSVIRFKLHVCEKLLLGSH